VLTGIVGGSVLLGIVCFTSAVCVALKLSAVWVALISSSFGATIHRNVKYATTIVPTTPIMAVMTVIHSFDDGDSFLLIAYLPF
jgi:hypothetical protein